MRRFFFAAAAAAVFLVGAVSPAKASFQIRISDGTNSVTVTDNQGGGADTDPTSGVIVVNTAFLTVSGITGWSQINVNTAFSNFGSGDNFAMLEVATSARSSSSTSTLIIDVTQTGFTVPSSAPNFALTSTVVATTVPGTETVQGFYDSTNSGNNAFSMPGQAQTTKQTVTSGVAPGNPVTTIITPGTSPFSLDYHIVLTASATSQFFSTDNQLTLSVPAPGGLLLVASGLPVCVIGCVRRRFKAAIASA